MFSFTEVLNDITLIVDRDTVPLFPEGTLEVSPITWRALLVDTGAEGQVVNLVKAISNPLANANIPIMQMSTYESDVTLVPECDLGKAVGCLTSTFRLIDVPKEVYCEKAIKTFDESKGEEKQSALTDSPPRDSGFSNAGPDVVDEGYCSRSSSIADPSTIVDPRAPANTVLSLPAEADAIGNIETHHTGGTVTASPTTVATNAWKGCADEIQRTLSPCIASDLFITSISEHSLSTFATRLIELLFFSDRRDRFLSFTRSTTANVSLILDQQTLDLFEPHSVQTLGGAWRMIRVGPYAGEDLAVPYDAEPGWFLEQCGIVRDSVERIADLGITDVFYLSTFTSDWVMVRPVFTKFATGTRKPPFPARSCLRFGLDVRKN
ncbi:MAG: hypothetical protein BJ554DRAFT_8361 [Olpidium bornovanus]|uniref:CASTOR ACT domain-containing protein n=1 Tax=Olpidium bornovanus TaxID=278681 RepID=A0A8H7ZU53_9FUNG|nr:MAG: hypothetical protein BJ554DRAFT_8361 [Olpidium bornovanus]